MSSGAEDTDPLFRPPLPGPPARPKFEFRRPPSAVPVTRPTVVTASWACWLAAAAALLGALVGPLLTLDAFRAELLARLVHDYPLETAATRDRVAMIATMVLVGGGALLVVLEVLGAVSMRSGRVAARVLLLLLVGPIVVHSLLMVTVATPLTRGFLGVEVGLALVAAVLMFLRGTGRWFSAGRH